jgi:hypothetical protein
MQRCSATRSIGRIVRNAKSMIGMESPLQNTDPRGGEYGAKRHVVDGMHTFGFLKQRTDLAREERK